MKKAAAVAMLLHRAVTVHRHQQERALLCLGTGCAKCHALEQVVREAAAEMALDEEVSYVTDIAQIAAYGIMTTPALVVDGQLVSYGKVLKKDEVKALIEKARGSHA